MIRGICSVLAKYEAVCKDSELSKGKLLTNLHEYTNLAMGNIFQAKLLLMQYPAPPVANQNDANFG